MTVIIIVLSLVFIFHCNYCSFHTEDGRGNCRNMSVKLRSVVFFLKLVSSLLLSKSLIKFCWFDSTHIPGLLILGDGAISHNRPQIASDRTIHEKSRNSQKNAQNS